MYNPGNLSLFCLYVQELPKHHKLSRERPLETIYTQMLQRCIKIKAYKNTDVDDRSLC